MIRYLMGLVVFAWMTLGATPLNYGESIRAWQAHRDQGLRSPTGWLALVGLYWLDPGDNTIGSANSNKFVLPKNSAPERVGTLHLAGDKVTYRPASGSAAKQLSYDEQKPDVIQAGSVQLYVIKRGEKFAVRAKDSESPTLKSFTGMTYFPINTELHVAGHLMPDVKKIPILNVLGETDMEESPGVVEFTYRKFRYRLRPIYEDSAEGKTLYFLFKDLTNRVSTYQSGRMMNTPLPVNGRVELDFNKAYNPPCTFTPYATCPLPPPENHLAFSVEAGEKRYGKGREELPAK